MADFSGVMLVAIQAVLFYGVLAFGIYKIVRIESEIRQVKTLIGEVRKAVEEKL